MDINAEVSEISQFYAGKSVFVTGATGKSKVCINYRHRFQFASI